MKKALKCRPFSGTNLSAIFPVATNIGALGKGTRLRPNAGRRMMSVQHPFLSKSTGTMQPCPGEAEQSSRLPSTARLSSEAIGQVHRGRMKLLYYYLSVCMYVYVYILRPLQVQSPRPIQTCGFAAVSQPSAAPPPFMLERLRRSPQRLQKAVKAACPTTLERGNDRQRWVPVHRHYQTKTSTEETTADTQRNHYQYKYEAAKQTETTAIHRQTPLRTKDRKRFRTLFIVI
jgi:hypothetical protein